MTSSLQTSQRSGPDSPFPRSACEDQGLSSSGVLRFLDEVDQNDIELHSLMVVRHGHVLAEGWWAPYAPDNVHLLYSISKSFTATGVGMAVAEGLLSIDDPVISFAPESVPEDVSDRMRAMRIRNLLTMATGHREDTTERVRATASDDPFAGFFSIPPDEDPGSPFLYHNAATYVLSMIVQRLSGQTLSDYLEERLFGPLGITRHPWAPDAQGHEIGFSGLHLRTEDLARFGQLYLREGRWDDHQLVARDWVRPATSFQIDNSKRTGATGPDQTLGYGFQFWRGSHQSFRCSGSFGQNCVVVPDQDLVVVTTAATANTQGVLTAIWNNLIPALSDSSLPADPAAQQTLRERLATATIPPLGSEEGVERSVSAGRWQTTEPSPFSAVELDASSRGWTLRVDTGHGWGTIAVGDGEWQPSVLITDRGEEVPVWSSGGQTSDQTFRADVIFVQTPNRMRLTCPADSDHYSLSWNIPPKYGDELGHLSVQGFWPSGRTETQRS